MLSLTPGASGDAGPKIEEVDQVSYLSCYVVCFCRLVKLFLCILNLLYVLSVCFKIYIIIIDVNSVPSK